MAGRAVDVGVELLGLWTLREAEIGKGAGGKP